LSAATTKIIARAAAQPLCDVVVIGVLPNGGGLYLDWNGTTTASLIMLCQAAIHEATEKFIEGIHVDETREGNQDLQGRKDQKIRLVSERFGEDQGA
jgi:hypothetical protein